MVLTTTASAARHYRRGVAHVLAGKVRSAQRAFDNATRQDPGFAVGHASVALTQYAQSDNSSRAAIQARDSLRWRATRRERQHVEVLATLVEGDPSRAVALGREHLGEFPLDLVVFRAVVSVHPATRADLADRIAAAYGADDAFWSIARGLITLTGCSRLIDDDT
jgi:hypothetical protein